MNTCFICGKEFKWFELFTRKSDQEEICKSCLEDSGTAEAPAAVVARKISQDNLKSLRRERIRERAK